MSDSSEGTVVSIAPVDVRISRIVNDYEALQRVRGPAILAAQRLIRVMLSGQSSSADIAAAAEDCHRSAGDLWDAAARVNEQRPK